MNSINRGTGAGGSNTNTNGKPYEEKTDLFDQITILEEVKSNSKKSHSLIHFNNKVSEIFMKTDQSAFFRCMNHAADPDVDKAHGCKNPDECYIHEKSKTIIIIEKKFQQTGGSVCEKIQTSDFKKWQYMRTFPDYNIVYIYCLSSWFKKNCIPELQYLELRSVPVFWGDDVDYKTKIVNFILSCI
jgi:hypothetical protein